MSTRLRRPIPHRPGSLGRLRDVRESRGMSINDLAEAAHVGRMTVIRAEGGRFVQSETIAKLAAALDVEPGELLTPTEDGDM